MSILQTRTSAVSYMRTTEIFAYQYCFSVTCEDPAWYYIRDEAKEGRLGEAAESGNPEVYSRLEMGSRYDVNVGEYYAAILAKSFLTSTWAKITSGSRWRAS